MNTTGKMFLRLAVAAALALGFGKAYAFHSGGVAECGGCHSMHSPQDVATGFLLVNSDQSSTCLSCHGNAGASSYHIATPDADMPAGTAPYNKSPGGDFGWLKKTYVFVVRNETITEHGSEHGHNIVAADFGYESDGTSGTSPGGSFPVAALTCASCHDQHGQFRRLSSGSIAQTGAPIVGSGSYNTSKGNSTANPIPAGQAVGVYRLLRGSGSVVQGQAFPGIPPAVAPGTYNRTEAVSQTRVAYGVGSATGAATWGRWCATCHGAMHSTGNYVHPVDSTMANLLSNYNNYVSSGILTGVFQANQGPFLSLAPFAKNTGDYTVLAPLAAAGATTTTTLAGPSDGDQVMCLSCHRAHASGFPWMLRWQMEGEFITVADTATGTTPLWPGIDNGAPPQFARGRTAAEQQTAYYERPATVFGVYQRVLCNKCHAKD